jgi:hypothetical protein
MSSLVVRCKHQYFDIYIGRSPTQYHYGNPFGFTSGTQALVIVGSREEAVQAFREWLEGSKWQDVEPDRRRWILEHLYTLRGKVLGCWCSPKACHGDVLAELANKD